MPKFERFLDDAGTAIERCRICDTDQFQIVGQGKNAEKQAFYNLRCRNGHLLTLRRSGELKVAGEDVGPPMVRIMKYEYTVVSTRHIILYLPEDINPKSHVMPNIRHFEEDVSDIVSERCEFARELPLEGLYNGEHLSADFDIFRGRLKSVEKREIKSGESDRKERRLL